MLVSFPKLFILLVHCCYCFNLVAKEKELADSVKNQKDLAVTVLASTKPKEGVIPLEKKLLVPDDVINQQKKKILTSEEQAIQKKRKEGASHVLQTRQAFLIPDEIDIPKNIEKKSAVIINSIFLSLEKQHQMKPSNVWSLKYRQALLLKTKDTKSFCKIMKELSQISNFPLKDLALIESYSLCPFEEPLFFNPSLVASWLDLELAKAFYKRRKFFDNPEETLKASFYLGKNHPYKELRTSYLKHALTLIKEKESKSKKDSSRDRQGQTLIKEKESKNKKDLIPSRQRIDQEAQQLDVAKNQTVIPLKAVTEKDIKKALYKNSPSLNPRFEKENYLLIAIDFKERRKFSSAITYYIKVLNMPRFSFDETNQAFQGLGHIYRVQKNRKKKIKNSNQWSSWLLKENTPQSLRKYYKKQLDIARQKWNLDKNQEAIALLTQLLKDKKSAIVKEEALLLRGSIYLQENQENLSVKDWDEVIKSLYRKKKKPSLLAKALWKKAWVYRKRKEYKKALGSFILLTDLKDNPYTYHRALFWAGQTYEDLGSCFYSRRFFKKLATKDIYGYYGLLSMHKLGQKRLIETNPLPELKIEIKALIHWLNLFQKKELLAHLLKKEIDQKLPDKLASLEEWLQVIWLWKESQEYLSVFQSFQKMNPEVQEALVKKHAQLLFPLSFYKEVKQASEKTNLPISFLLSIIRQESAFNVRARSPADAFGLMQVIPSTARQVSRQNNIRYRGYRDLYKPSKNIQIGSTYISKLLKQYEQNFILAVAAYNAGNTPVNRWKKELSFWTALEFIENIPYKETRNYIRLIARNYIFYHQLINQQTGSTGQENFPQELKKVFKEDFFKCSKKSKFLL